MVDSTERVSEISARMERSQPSRATNDENNGRNLNIVIRRLPETHNENLRNKLSSLIKDGLKLRDKEVAAAERKTLYSESLPGVVIATLSSMEDKKNVLSKKSSLKSSRR